MALWENLLKNDVARGVAIGAGVVAVGVLLTPALRPVARATVKSGILIFEKGREWLAEASETLEDLVAEVRADLAGVQMDTAGQAEAAAEAAEAAMDMTAAVEPVAEPVEVGG